MLAEIIPALAGMEKQERSDYYPRPSLAGPERCIRQMTYWGSKTSEDKQVSDRFILTIDDSTWHEYLTIDWINKSAYKLHSQQMEVGLKDSMIRPGHMDGIITDLLNIDRVFEHKALNHFTFEKYWKGEWPLDYITQCCIYIKGAKRVNPDISEAVLLIKNKNTAQYFDMIIVYDDIADTSSVFSMSRSTGEVKVGKNNEPLFVMEGVVWKAETKFQIVSEHIKQQSLPDRPYGIDDWHCSYCNWGETCWRGYEKEYESLAQDAVFEGEIIDHCKYYLETGYHIREMEKEKESLKIKIKELLKAKNASKGKAGPFTIHNQLRNSSRLDKDLIPENILKKATKTGFIEVLDIRKIKEEKEGKT